MWYSIPCGNPLCDNDTVRMDGEFAPIFCSKECWEKFTDKCLNCGEKIPAKFPQQEIGKFCTESCKAMYFEWFRVW